MIIVKWGLRVIFLWIPLVFIVLYGLIGCLILPFFFGNGIEDFWKFAEKEDLKLLAMQFCTVLVANALYERIWSTAGHIRSSIVSFLLECVDRVYDKLLGGPFGRGQSKVAELISMLVYLFCIGFCAVMLVYIGAYLYIGLSEMSFSWSAWMKWKYAERISYRWLPLTFGLMLVTEPLLHVIDRPVCGIVEKAAGCFKNRSNTNIVSVQEDTEDE